MPTLSLNQVVILYTWLVLAILLSILLLIARFYQNVSQQRTGYRVFGVIILIFGAASARAAFSDNAADVISDGLWFVGGTVLIALCVHLYRLMTAGRP